MAFLSYSGRGFAFLWALRGVHPCHVFNSPRGFGAMQVGTFPDVLVMEPKLTLAALPGLCFGGTQDPRSPGPSWCITPNLMDVSSPRCCLALLCLALQPPLCPSLSAPLNRHWRGLTDTSGAFQNLTLLLGGAALLLNLVHLGLSSSVLKLYCKCCCVQRPPWATDQEVSQLALLEILLGH